VEPVSSTAEQSTTTLTAGFFFNEVTNSIEAIGSTLITELLGGGVTLLLGCDGLAVALDDGARQEISRPGAFARYGSLEKPIQVLRRRPAGSPPPPPRRLAFSVNNDQTGPRRIGRVDPWREREYVCTGSGADGNESRGVLALVAGAGD
jgi:hypothetical protein